MASQTKQDNEAACGLAAWGFPGSHSQVVVCLEEERGGMLHHLNAALHAWLQSFFFSIPRSRYVRNLHTVRMSGRTERTAMKQPLGKRELVGVAIEADAKP